MGDRLRVTILGCGSSPGVPRINGDWGACDPANPKNRRRRASAMVERIAASGAVTRFVIDTGPDLRKQMIDAGVDRLDAVVLSHPHADHIHGIDDVRGFFLVQRQLIPTWADDATMERLRQSFGYCLETPPGSNYPPILAPNRIEHGQSFRIDGLGGPIDILPLPVGHGDIVSLGFRIGSLAYISDISLLPPASASQLLDLDVLIIDALQPRPHYSHFSLGQALECIEMLAPRRGVLTHMHIPLDYDAVARETPDHVEPAFDGMEIELAWPTL